MNQKTILLALGLTLTITTALAIAPVNEMAYARSHRGNGGGTSGTSMGGAPSSMINHAKTMGNLTTSSMMSDVKTMGNLSSGSLN